MTLVDLNGQPGLEPGEEFDVEVQVTDVRDPGDLNAAFAGYGDLHFDPRVVRVDGVTYTAEYPHLRTGEVNNVSGLVNELGATDSSGVLDETTMLTLHLTVLDAGETTLTSDAGERAVSHCYQRPSFPPRWPYNLMTMIHGRNEDEVHGVVRRLLADLEPIAHAVLFSPREFKKERVRYFIGETATPF